MSDIINRYRVAPGAEKPPVDKKKQMAELKQRAEYLAKKIADQKKVLEEGKKRVVEQAAGQKRQGEGQDQAAAEQRYVKPR
jgi:hypothetical protein